MQNSIQDLSKEDNTVDISDKEARYAVQCDDIRLITSTLRPLVKKDDAEEFQSHFSFRIRAVVQDNESHGYLEVQANHYIIGEPEELHGYQLRFVFMATFIPDQGIPPEELGAFVKRYTLSILWPYAREYASDQFRRAGEDNFMLPIINSQVVTEQLLENDLIQVEIIPPDKPGDAEND